ncbi:hypothetical protein ACLMJK_007376 [Lecanora helva]
MSEYETILKSKESTLSYKLPHMLRRQETKVREFRAGLPESRFSSEDRQAFQDDFEQYIDKSNLTVFLAQKRHVHISGTLRKHVRGTKWLEQNLNDTLYRSHGRVLTDGVMATSMGWLNDRYLVHLPYGIEPFKLSPSYNDEIAALNLIKTHVSEMQNRVHVDIDLTSLLQTALLELSTISQGIEARAALIQRDNEDAAHAQAAALRGGVWWFLTYSLIGQALPDYQVGQRQKWLEAKRPVFRDSIKFFHDSFKILTGSASDLTGAKTSWNILATAITHHGQAARRGVSIRNWIVYITEQLGEGFKELESALEHFKVMQMRFNEEVSRS